MKTLRLTLWLPACAFWSAVALAELAPLPTLPAPGAEPSDGGFPGEPAPWVASPVPEAASSVDEAAPVEKVESPLERLMKAAESMLEEKAYPELIELCQEAIFGASGSAVAAKALHYSALAHAALGETQVALDVWDQALANPSIEPELRFKVTLNIALTLLQTGDANAAYERIGTLSPPEIEARSQSDQKRYFLLSAQAARALGQPEVAAEIYANQFGRFARHADQEEMLRELDESLIEIQERESIAELLSKVNDPDVRTRISKFVELIPRLRRPAQAPEDLRWKKLSASYRLSLDSGLSLLAYQQTDVSLTSPSSVIGASGRSEAESGLVTEIAGRLAFATFGGIAVDAPRLFRASVGVGKLWRLSSVNGFEVRGGVQYLTLVTSRDLLLKNSLGPRVDFDFRRWMDLDDWFEFGIGLGLFGDGTNWLTTANREWTFRFSIFRRFDGAIRRLGLGLEFGTVNLVQPTRVASSQSLQALFHVHF